MCQGRSHETFAGPIVSGGLKLSASVFCFYVFAWCFVIIGSDNASFFIAPASLQFAIVNDMDGRTPLVAQSLLRRGL